MVKLTSLLRWNGTYNIPKKYILRRMFNGVVYENNYYMTPAVVYDYCKNFVYTEDAPWTTAAQNANDPKRRKEKPPLAPPFKDWVWFRGDLVQILVGKDAGKIGEIAAVIQQRNWIIVGGLNCKFEKIQGSSQYKQAETPLIVNREVKLIDPLDKKPCDVVWRFSEAGERIRVSKRSGRLIPIPDVSKSTVDYSSKQAYKPSDKDTINDVISAKTFIPKLKSFEDDLAEEYNIVDTRTRAPTYFY